MERPVRRSDATGAGGKCRGASARPWDDEGGGLAGRGKGAGAGRFKADPAVTPEPCWLRVRL